MNTRPKQLPSPGPRHKTSPGSFGHCLHLSHRDTARDGRTLFEQLMMLPTRVLYPAALTNMTAHVLDSCHCDFTEVSSVTLRYPRRSSGVTCHGDDYKRHNSFVTCSCWRNVALLHAGKILRRLNRSKLLLLATELLIAQ